MSTEQLLGVIYDTASTLQKTQINLKKCPKSRLTRGYLETRLKCIDEYWDTFKQAHRDIIKLTSREQQASIPYLLNEEYFIYEDLYLNMQGDVKDLLHKIMEPTEKTTTVPAATQVNNQVGQLPKIQLPVFTGVYELWPAFKDLFTSIVHNNASLSQVEKLHYLKTSVSGEAEALLKQIQVTESNYKQAWDVLVNRYGNKKLTVNSILKRLFFQKKMSTQSASQLKLLLDNTTECLQSLKNLEIKTDSWDPLIIFLVVQKLDPESHKDWEQESQKDNADKLPTWDDLVKFMESKFQTLELVASSSSAPREKSIKERTFHATSPAEKLCVMCKDHHKLCHCKQFAKMQPEERCEYVKTQRLCFNCLAPGHAVFNCRVSVTCRICRRRHHTLLHTTKNTAPTKQSTQTQLVSSEEANEKEKEEIQSSMAIASHHISKRSVALLATAMVNVRNEQGHTITLRALIDQGSQASFISERAAQALKVTRESASGSIVGVGSTRTNIKQVVQIEVSSHYKKTFSMQLRAYVISKQLTTKMPTKTIATKQWSHIQNLHLADPSYDTPGYIDLLLGVKEYAQIIEGDIIRGPPGTPCAHKTRLGWILFGEIETNREDNSFMVMHHQVDVDDFLKAMWELDTDITRRLTKAEEMCEDIYEKTYKRNEEGKYVVKLPFKTKVPRACEGNTKEIAKNRLLQLERRFQRMPTLKDEYVKVIEDYIKLKHIEQVPEDEINSRKSVYLPHHAVVNEEKETTKTRIVFDASCKGSNGISLNDDLLVGPVLQEDLRSLIIRWRMHAVCLASDIQKMYRMIQVFPEDADYQRILWRADTTEKIKDYRLLTVTFGTASAPYLAVKTLLQLSKDLGDDYPVAARMIKTDFYVDDLMSGCDTVEEAIEAYTQLKTVLHTGGFELKKWSSNSIEFMRSIPTEERSAKAKVDLKIEGTIKALGVQWNLGTDQFEYKLILPPSPNPVTKRNILSDVQKLFDPLGWIAPCIVLAKIFIQKLWMAKVNWDEEVSQTLKEEWITLRSDLSHANEICIDRWVNTLGTELSSIQIHGFSDASIQAYGGAVYIRVEKSDGTVKTSLLAARTRVAPVKTISLPRLELCGAVLLSKLLIQVSSAMRIPASQIFAWTDSSIVLSWILGDPQQWKTFVANRVVEITGNVSQGRWYHVASQDNPADIASRGMFLSQLKDSKLWWKGPRWLSERKIQLVRPNPTEIDTERRHKVIQVNAISEEEPNHKKLSEQFNNFENLTELLRVISYCSKFLNMKKQKTTDMSITTIDLRNALHVCIKVIQKEEFMEDMEILKLNKPVKGISKIKTLNPYLDDEGILRVGGRLRHANIQEESKHPIILGNKNNLTPLIIANAHIKTLHGGIQLMLGYLRSQYWILRAKSLVKTHVRECLVCAKHNASPKPQLMGDLPKERVAPTRPFLHSGVDFAGPFATLLSRSRGAKTMKTYVALFICMSTKCIHLELVGDLTSEAFIAAFKRFVARRGRCTHLWSDQGRNFVGASKELLTAWKEAQFEFPGSIAESLATDGTQMHNIPAYSPNFGGLWEAGIRSMKTHLKRIVTRNLTFEEMSTVLCEIEACLNSRPLCPIDDEDTENIRPLTPGHFLIGESPINVPCPELKDVRMSTLSRWQHTQKIVRDFWTRWQREYLTRLQQRPKWLKRVEELEKGNIVSIKMDNLPPGKWALGRIVDKHPGADGVTRVYSVKSGEHIVKRPITKLCLLPVDIKD